MRTIEHPGPRNAVRLEHARAEGARHLRLTLLPGGLLHASIVGALGSVGVESASMTLFGGELETLAFCLPEPDPNGRLAATYGAPIIARSAQLLFGSATLGRSPGGAPVVHCHAVFRTVDNAVRGGHLLGEKTRIGASPVRIVVTALDGLDLRIGFDEETRMQLLRPHRNTDDA